MIGDLPDADVKPPSNMLFICKLNPVTTEEDLELIFSQVGTSPHLFASSALHPAARWFTCILLSPALPTYCSAAR